MNGNLQDQRGELKMKSPRHGQLDLRQLSVAANHGSTLIGQLINVFGISTAEELYHFELDHPGVLALQLPLYHQQLNALIENSRQLVAQTEKKTRVNCATKKFPVGGALLDDEFSLPAGLRKDLKTIE